MCGIWWGLPQFWSWAPDEVLPGDVFEALRQRFGGGWHGLYPPVHLYLLALVFLPFEVGARLGVVDIWADHSYVVLFLLARGVSALMGVVTIYVVYLCALELGRSRVAGLCSAFLFALMPPFIFYSTTANVDGPYICWFALSLLFYIRAVRTDRLAAYGWFAVTGMLAVCTKDQAYGFYVFPALHLMWHRYRAVSDQTLGGLGRLARDGRLWMAATGAVVVFVVGQNLVFNLDGFLAHVALMLGDASQGYQRWEGTVGGHLAMAWAALGQLSWSFGWPALLVCVAGVARRSAWRERFLLLPAVSYYICFVSVVLYHYDRFFLGICLVLALFGGSWLATQLEATRGRRWRQAGVAGVLLASFFGSIRVSQRQLADAMT